ncbi:Hypothetical predicted protein [Podarcis lilfordi]|uniref:Uncharacterized protein n=1 Tax=Podarcis lilfordi TaxID=74358 RepID=A0AA35KGK6_9SAUR|nr:Hypothetical predicted protein [Podarcis lilfordi]
MSQRTAAPYAKRASFCQSRGRRRKGNGQRFGDRKLKPDFSVAEQSLCSPPAMTTLQSALPTDSDSVVIACKYVCKASIPKTPTWTMIAVDFVQEFGKQRSKQQPRTFKACPDGIAVVCFCLLILYRFTLM